MIDNIPQNIAIFPISMVRELTSLSGRQIRYYEEQGLINPARNDGNQRIFSLNDIDRFLEIKRLIDLGVNIAGIRAILSDKEKKNNVVPLDRTDYTFSEREWEEMLIFIQKKVEKMKNSDSQ